MTIDEVEVQDRNEMRMHPLEERVGDSVAFLSYSMDDKNQMTIWHTEVPPSLQHMGIGRKLVEEAVQLASRDSPRLRIVGNGNGLDILVDRTRRLEEEILSWSREFRVAL